MVHPKVAAATAGAAIAVIVMAILRQSGVPVDGDLGGAIATLTTLIAGYLMPADTAVGDATGIPASIPPPRPTDEPAPAPTPPIA